MTADSVEVMYDYNYNTSEGKHITINKGDIFTLLAKSTNEWWKVRKGEREKFYVPASYVKLLMTGSAVQQSPSHSVTVHSDIPSVPLNGHHRTTSNASSCASTADSIDSQSYDGSLDSKGESLDRTASLPTQNSRVEDVAYANNSMLTLSLQPTIIISPDSTTSPSPEEPVTYANMAIIQDIIAQRKENSNLQPSSDQETWEMHTDDGTGNVYYFNSVTKETTWESPVIKRRPFTSNMALSQSMLNKRLSRVTSFRKGWTETVSEDGTKIYVHNATGEKWHMAVDASGKEYYYNEQSQESLWDLPEGGYTLRNAAQSANSFDTHKRGYLHRAKVTEGKKKVKKNWSLAYVVAYDNNLLIYKDEKAAAKKPDAEFGKPEAIIDLKHAMVDWSSKDKSARKNVLEVTSASGTCYLFQHEDNILIHQWHVIILGKVRKFNQAIADIPETLGVPEVEGNNNDTKSSTLSSKRKQRSSRYSKSSSLKKKHNNNGAGKSVYTLHEENAEFQAPTSHGPAGEPNKSGIREKLKKFLTRRPTQESLEKKGIFQAERVFGSRLQFICDRESTAVPAFVENCISAIETKGLDFDGLYRINGNQAQIQKLRFLVDSSDDYNLADYDVNVLTGALKLFFRELKEPLIPFHLYNILSETIKDKDQAKKSRMMKMQLATMPTANLATLKCLFAHLARVHEHVHENRMRSQNIAIVFGPTLMWPEKESSAIAANMMCQNSIVEYILSHLHKLL